MDFNSYNPIYIQIADNMCERILSGQWVEDGRVPSVRELGMQLGVNPNTVMRSFDYLQSNQIIYNKRGIGYFVSPGARVSIRKQQKNAFINQELPRIFQKMDILGIDINEILPLYKANQH